MSAVFKPNTVLTYFKRFPIFKHRDHVSTVIKLHIL